MKKKKKLLSNRSVGDSYAALSSLGASLKDTVLRFRIAENLELLSKHRETWLKERNAIIDGNTEKDESGSPKVNGNDYVWTDDESKQDLIDLDKAETEIQYVRIMLSKLAEDTSKHNTEIDYAALFPLLGWLIWDDIPDDAEDEESP